MRSLTKKWKWQKKVFLAFVIFTFSMMAWLSVLRYRSFNSAMLDLGNMSQAIWSVTQGKPLVYTKVTGQRSRLAGHIELFYFLLAIPYAVIPSPITLLVLQAAVFVAGAFPVFRLSQRKLKDQTAALFVSMIYLFYPVAQTAVLFDIHGDTFAMVFLLFAIEAMDRDRKKTYFAWLILALSCKFYVAFAIIALAIPGWLDNKKKLSYYTGILGVSYLIFAFVIQEHFRNFGDAGNALKAVGGNLLHYIYFYFGDLRKAIKSIPLRGFHGIIALAPGLFFGARSISWMIPTAFITIPILISSGPGPVYDFRTHHYALIVPFLITAVIYGSLKIKDRQNKKKQKKQFSRTWRSDLKFTLFLTLLFNLLFVSTPLSYSFYKIPYLGTIEKPVQGITPRDEFKKEWLDTNIPDKKPLAVDIFLAPHLINREVLFSTYYTNNTSGGNLSPSQFEDIASKVDYFVVDIYSEYFSSELIQWLITNPDFGIKTSQNGMLLFAKGDEGLVQEVFTEARTSPAASGAMFNENIMLIDFNLTTSGERKFILEYEWAIMTDSREDSSMFAITQFSGAEHAQFFHLPTYLIKPVEEWRPGNVYREKIEVDVPEAVPVGKYELEVTWYDAPIPCLIQQDRDRYQVGDSVKLGVVELP
jgi:uncharacterized membrane protein